MIYSYIDGLSEYGPDWAEMPYKLDIVGFALDYRPSNLMGWGCAAQPDWAGLVSIHYNIIDMNLAKIHFNYIGFGVRRRGKWILSPRMNGIPAL